MVGKGLTRSHWATHFRDHPFRNEKKHHMAPSVGLMLVGAIIRVIGRL